MIMANLVLAQPSFADRPKFQKNPDYIEVTQTLENLILEKDTPTELESSTLEETQNKIDELKFLKYTLETGINWGQCRNETGKTLAIYGPKPNNIDEDNYLYDNGLYLLAAGHVTKNEWDCDGVYLPSDVKTTAINSEGQDQELGGPVAVKIADGTQLVVQTTPDTPGVKFNTPLTKVFKAGEVNWFIPKVPQAVIDTRVANAPAVKIPEETQLVARKNPEKDIVESNSPAKTPPPAQAESQLKPPKPQW